VVGVASLVATCGSRIPSAEPCISGIAGRGMPPWVLG
jgi:hypothetical protein